MVLATVDAMKGHPILMVWNHSTWSMACKVFASAEEALTPTADVFGLAVLLYELPCGRPTVSPRVAQAAISARRPAVALCRYRSGLPNELERLLEACLAPGPLARPALPDLLVVLNWDDPGWQAHVGPWALIRKARSAATRVRASARKVLRSPPLGSSIRG